MKRGILLATLMVTTAGVASANLLTQESRTASAPPAAKRYAPAVTEAVAVPSLSPAPLAATQAPVALPVAQEQNRKAPQKVSVEARQAPVPLQVRPRVTAKSPTIDALIAAQSADAKDIDKDAEQAAAEPAVATDDGFSEAKAKAAIEADGYKGVTALRKGEKGIWHAKALRGKTEVMLTVDAGGSVAAD